MENLVISAHCRGVVNATSLTALGVLSLPILSLRVLFTVWRQSQNFRARSGLKTEFLMKLSPLVPGWAGADVFLLKTIDKYVKYVYNINVEKRGKTQCQ